MRLILTFYCAFVLFGLVSNGIASDPHEKKRTNIVVFLVDDLGWTDVGCFGSSFYQTPNIDRLAKRATRFTSAYSTCQVCSPTRASMLTGKYPQRVGITDFINPGGGNQPEKWNRKTEFLPASYQDHLALSEMTLAEKLKENGYATFFAGKWHLGDKGFWPEDQGFDINKGGIEKGGPYGGKKYFSPYDNPRLTDGPDGEHLPDRLATEAAQFIADHKTQPFLTYLSFYSVHTPLMARKDLKQKYEDLKSRVRIAGPIWGREEPRKFRLVQEHAVYAAMVTAMDEAVGKVIDELEKNDLLESTMILFTSDNGGLSTSEGHPTTNLPLRAGKGWIYEGGIRVPTIVHIPGLPRPDSVCDTPISSVDYFPTVLDLAGISNENLGLDGESILPLLRGESQARKPIYWHYPHYGNQGGSPSAAIRDGEWKLIQWLETGQYSLYNLSKDTGEQNDLVDDHPDVVQALSEKLQEWQKDVGAKPLTRRVK